MPDHLTAACIQLNSSPDIADNLDRCAALIKQAAEKGAKLILTPENTCHIRAPITEKLNSAYAESDHPAIPMFSALAKELKITIIIGSLSIKDQNGKLWNRTYVFNENGNTDATYDKIHLFDVQLPSGETHKESDVMNAGNSASLVKLGGDFNIGLSICYDVRFAYLYRALAQAGANILCIPAAFTVPTGKAHWETLLRARAIETGSYVLAAAQDGEHEGGRKTYGHSMIINPWGEVESILEEGEGFILADLQIDKVNQARTAIPALTHDKTIEVNIYE